jgi:transposase
VSEPTVSQRDAASTLFNLPGYRVIDAVDIVGGSRRVLVVSTEPPGCPGCGVISTRVHQRTRQRVRDVPVAGAVEVVWCKRRWICAEDLCAKATFAEATMQVPARARSTVRLRHALVVAVVMSGRAVSETARAHGVSWWAVQSALTAALLVLPTVGDVVVKRLGIDEHRYRSVRYFRTPSGGWWRFEPGGTSRSRGRMSTIVDVTTGQVLGVVDGRDSAGVGAWLAARPARWLEQVEVVAIDPSAAFRKALRTHLPRAAVSVDPFHLVKLGNDTLTAVRQRLSRDHKGRLGRLVDPAWANRKLLLRGADTLSERGWGRLEQVLRTDDPTDELGAAWGIKEQLRRLLKTTTLADAHEAKMLLGHYVMVADMPETDRLWNTICAWWTEIEVLIVTGVTNARTEAANTGIKHLKRTGRGFRNADNYRARILLSSAARRAA